MAEPVETIRLDGAAPAAALFETILRRYQSDAERAKIVRYFKTGDGDYGEGDVFIGVRMGQLFAVAKAFTEMPAAELEILLESPVHELRAGACSIMGQAAKGRIGDERREELYRLYLRRHDRINNWDLVDLAAGPVIGRYLLDRPRDILFQLARSDSVWERRTALYASMVFLGRRETADVMALCELLAADPHELIHKAVGGVLRFAGGKDRAVLDAFLERHAAAMPRVMLRYALEHHGPDERARFMGMKG